MGRAGARRARRGDRSTRVTLLADDAGDAVVWHARRPGLWQRTRRPSRRHDLAALLDAAKQGRLMDIVRRAVPALPRQSLAAAGVHPVLARVFAARGVATPDELDHRSRDAAGVRDDEGHRRRGRAPRRRDRPRSEKIVIVADYDADGATACAVGVRGLAAMGAVVDFLVPNRFEYGYGLTPEIVAAGRARWRRGSSSPSTTASRATTASRRRPRAASKC